MEMERQRMEMEERIEIERIRANGWGSIALSESAVDKSSYGNCRGANWLEPSPPTTIPYLIIK